MKKIILLTFLLISSFAHAGFLIEPYAGYDITKVETNFIGTIPTGPTSTKKFDKTNSDTLKGSVFGGKLGYAIPFLAFGGDFQMSSGNGFKATDYGPFVEVRLPLFLKLRATYFMSSKISDDDDNGFSGNGFKAGIGFSLLSLLSLNLDYISSKYTIDDKDGDNGMKFTSADTTRQGVMVSLSFPFEI